MLVPVWRQKPGPSGVGYVAFDPVDAERYLTDGFVVVDNIRLSVDLIGCDDVVQNDGRVSVRVAWPS